MSEDTLFIKRNRASTKVVEASYTRPADTNPYTAGDVVANSTSAPVVLTFANIARALGRGGVIQSALMVDSSSESLKPDFELYLFDTSPTIQNDNAAWAPTDADMANCLGVISFVAANFKVGSGNGIIEAQNIAFAFQCEAATASIFGILVARNAYVPTSAEVFTIRLRVLQD